MINPQNFFQQMQENLGKFSQEEPFSSMEKNTKAMLAAVLSKMEVVTKEEYEVQQAALLSCYQRIEQLEAKLGEMQTYLESVKNNK